MNKPAPKEPSMDEILSSIRQIIADDDAAAGRRPLASPQPAAPVASGVPAASMPIAAPEPRPSAPPAAMPALQDEVEPLTLTAAQIISAPVEDDPMSDLDAQLLDPEDVSFDFEEPTPMVHQAPPQTIPAYRPEPPAAMPERPRARVAEAAPMPDPRLSADMAEELIEPATNAAVRSTFSKLQNLGIGAPGLTLEAMMRDMLRPMLKEWLDENLPAVVERMVEKEIARISRGIE